MSVAARNHVISSFRMRNPLLDIRPYVKDGTQAFNIVLKPNDEKNAVAGDVHSCTIARGIKRTLRKTVKDQAVFASVAYLLEDLGNGRHEIIKYSHDGAPITHRLDQGIGNQSNQVVGFRPPRGARKTGPREAPKKQGAKRDPEAVRKSTETRKRNRDAALALRSL